MDERAQKPDTQAKSRTNATRAADAARASSACELTLSKGRHTWRFRCDHAEEPLLLSVIAQLAKDTTAGLDQFDLAVLANQLQEHFAADHEAELGEAAAPSQKTLFPTPRKGRGHSSDPTSRTQS